MEVDSARVRNFKSIVDSGEVDIKEDITTFIGANESGKTAFLEAIATIDHNDRYDDSEINSGADVSEWDTIIELHCGNYITKKLRNGCRIVETNRDDIKVKSVEFVSELIEYLFENPVDIDISEDKINEFKNKHNIPSSNSVEEMDRERLGKLMDDILSKLLTENNTRESDVSGRLRALVSDEREKFGTSGITLKEHLLIAQPSIIYIDSTDNLDDEVPMSSVGSEKHRTFNNLIRISEHDPGKLDDLKAKEQARVINKISAEIDSDLNEIWGQKTVKINIQQANNNYVPIIRDVEVDNEEVVRGPRLPSERSQGFQWFLSFLINTSAVANDSNNKLILLDDPATLLHPEGKNDWISAIEEMADDNQILYTSHSPYLIRKDRPSRIRIVEDRSAEGTKITDEFSETDENSLEPLRNALGIGIGSTLFATIKKLLVEGPSDKHILRGVVHFLTEYENKQILDMNSISVIPAGGANKMIQAAKWVESEDFAFAILLDKDQKGNDIVENISSNAPDIPESRVMQLTLDDDKPNNHIEIEDMFPAEFYIKCVNESYDSVEDYNEISISSEGGQKFIGDIEYNDRKIASKIDKEFSNKENGDLDKLRVSKEIERKLKGGDASEDHVSSFLPILDKMNELI